MSDSNKALKEKRLSSRKNGFDRVDAAELRVRRIMARDGIDERYARMRISAQKSDEFYRGKCDYELSNTAETPEDFREIARDFFRRLIGELREEKNEASR